MRVEKKKISDLELCYWVTTLQYQGKRHLLVASEKAYSCLLFDESGKLVDEVWKEPGGTMTAVQLPGVDGAFLATHRMYSPNDNKLATIVLCWHEDGQWKIKTLLNLPGVHRFDILSRNGVNYLIACTLKSDYEYKDDWRFPGKVWACPLPKDLKSLPEDYRLPVTVIREGLLKNHGYSRSEKDGVQVAIVTSEEGVFSFMPPAAPGQEWEIEHLLNEPTSDALLLDFDGDGEKEMLTLSPFHGDTLRIFKQKNGAFEQIFEYEKKIEFAHAICAATLNGKPFAVIGYRKKDRDLLAVKYENGGYAVEVLDHDVGPANALSIQVDGKTVIFSANREINEVAYYTVTED